MSILVLTARCVSHLEIVSEFKSLALRQKLKVVVGHIEFPIHCSHGITCRNHPHQSEVRRTPGDLEIPFAKLRNIYTNRRSYYCQISTRPNHAGIDKVEMHLIIRILVDNGQNSIQVIGSRRNRRNDLACGSGGRRRVIRAGKNVRPVLNTDFEKYRQAPFRIQRIFPGPIIPNLQHQEPLHARILLRKIGSQVILRIDDKSQIPKDRFEFETRKPSFAKNTRPSVNLRPHLYKEILKRIRILAHVEFDGDGIPAGRRHPEFVRGMLVSDASSSRSSPALSRHQPQPPVVAHQFSSKRRIVGGRTQRSIWIGKISTLRRQILRAHNWLFTYQGIWQITFIEPSATYI